jgi:hypothetical protein
LCAKARLQIRGGDARLNGGKGSRPHVELRIRGGEARLKAAKGRRLEVSAEARNKVSVGAKARLQVRRGEARLNVRLQVRGGEARLKVAKGRRLEVSARTWNEVSVGDKARLQDCTERLKIRGGESRLEARLDISVHDRRCIRVIIIISIGLCVELRFKPLCRTLGSNFDRNTIKQSSAVNLCLSARNRVWSIIGFIQSFLFACD